MAFLRRRKPAQPPPPPAPALEEVPAQQWSLKLAYLARSSNGLRLAPGPGVMSTLPTLVEPLSATTVETVEPLPNEYADAAPQMEHFAEFQQWLLARHGIGPVARHALYLLELTDAVDMTVDTLVCGLLHGEVETSGYPTYSAIVGGLASHFDELNGDLIVRGVVGWGGRGQRGDTERMGQRLLSAIHQQVMASGLVKGTVEPAPQPAGGAPGSVCSHCGFDARGTDAFYCPKCGMRLSRA